jgi:membrane-associated protein
MPDVTQLALLFASAWGAYLVIALLVMADAVLPVVPAEAAVLAGAALAARGQLHIEPLLAATAVGALGGDLVSYRAGRLLASGRRARRSRARLRAAERWLHRSGGAVLVAARFVPGGRTASTLTAGLIGLSVRRVAFCAAIGGMLWSAYLVGVGYAGGRLLDVPPLVLAPVLAVTIAVLSAVVGLAVRRVRGRRAAPVTASDRGPSTRTTGSPMRSQPAPTAAPVPPAASRWPEPARSDPPRQCASGTAARSAGPPPCAG